MARKKPYTKGLMVLDILLTLLTCGLWLMIVPFRELYMYGSNSNRQNNC